MLRALSILEFVTYIAPWMLSTFICLIGMIASGEQADRTKRKLAAKDKELSYLKRRHSFYKLMKSEASETSNNNVAIRKGGSVK